jgi:hypothetical protein
MRSVDRCQEQKHTQIDHHIGHPPEDQPNKHGLRAEWANRGEGIDWSGPGRNLRAVLCPDRRSDHTHAAPESDQHQGGDPTRRPATRRWSRPATLPSSRQPASVFRPHRGRPCTAQSIRSGFTASQGRPGGATAGSAQESFPAFITGLPPIAVLLPGIKSVSLLRASPHTKSEEQVFRRSFTTDIEAATAIEETGPVMVRHQFVGVLHQFVP